MAFQAENRFHLGIKFLGDGTIVSRTALVESLVRENVGRYLLTMSEGVGTAEEVHACETATNGKLGALHAIQRVSDTQYRITTFDNVDAPADQQVYFTMHRISNSNGL